MEKTYQPHNIEQKHYNNWLKGHYFAPSQYQPSCYSIVLPPPNVTGSLHMGHGFQCSVMDALTRYQRMNGKNTLWQGGTDHAGIATQMVVERQLEAQGSSRNQLGREAFTDKIWQWKQESGDNINHQLQRLGTSIDWSRERFTMDDGFSQAVLKNFVTLYDEGIIYRGKRLVNWDPKFRSAVSDLEVIQDEEDGKIWYINYPIINSKQTIQIATTRPETLLADVAVAVHPDDSRYQHLIGQLVQLPIANRPIPIIADDYVDPEFGSGCVKITPAHDFNDYEVGVRHQLPFINIFHPDASLNEHVPVIYQGLDRFVARKKILAELTALNLLAKQQDHKITLPRGDRSGEILEPYLTDQWYVKMSALAQPAIDAVRNGHIKLIPNHWDNTYYQWMENIQDWCISRQLWWGHRIPAWYDDQGQIYVAENAQQLQQKYQLSDISQLKQDEDVLDTWFSSALWPFICLGWPNDLETFSKFYPTNVLVTGFDILFFWVARMIMMSIKFTGQIPFREVYITGLIRDADGKKMSKSKGNVLDPLDIIDGIDSDALVQKRCSAMMQPTLANLIAKQTQKQFPHGIQAYGTDALRFTYCALATPGRNIRFDMNRVEGYRNFCNKIWNASRYVLLNTEEHASDLLDGPLAFSLADKWIKTRLQEITQQAHHYFTQYRFDLLSQCLYDFMWNEYCDWYLELTKTVLYAEHVTNAEKRGTRQTLLEVLESTLKLLHPVMPFITEEIWQRISPLLGINGHSIMLQSYPQYQANAIDEEAKQTICWLQACVIAIRNIRGEMNIAPNKMLPLFFAQGSDQDRHYAQLTQRDIQNLAKCEAISWINEEDHKPIAATAFVNELEILIPMHNLIDKDAELQRLNKELEKVNKDIARAQSKLDNPDYVNKAPTAVVTKEREHLVQLQKAQTKIAAQLVKINAL